MSESTPEPQQDWRFTPNELYPAGITVPDQEMADCLMNAVYFNTFRPSDCRRDLDSMHPGTLENCFGRHANLFLPPRRFSAHGQPDRNSRTQKATWSHFADMVLEAGEHRVFGDPGIDGLQRRFEGQGGIDNVRRSYSVGDNQGYLYFDITPDGSRTGDAGAIETVRTFKDELKRLLREAVVAILQDRTFMEKVTRSAELFNGLLLNVVFEDVLGRIDFLRNRTESSEDREALVDIVKQAILILGYSDVDVEILSTRDALYNACQGLYTPETQGSDGKAKISIPLSLYGTERILELDEILEIVAHELAHHALRNNVFANPNTGDGHHHLAHSVMSGALLQRLRALQYSLPKSGSAGFTVNEAVAQQTSIVPLSQPTHNTQPADSIISIVRRWLGF